MAQDGSETFLGGQDASKDPSLIAPQSYYSGINLNIQKGVLSPRWGFNRNPLTYPDGGIQLSNLTTRSYKDIFNTGRFQAGIPYVSGNTYYSIIVINGVIFGRNDDSNELFVIPIADGSLLDGSSPRINWCSAGDFLILFDFPAYPVIIENLFARRADPALDEIPISVLGTYNQNRIFIGNAGNEFTAGDPSGSTIAPDAPITFFEVLDIGSQFFGQVFQLPTSYSNDDITAMVFLQFSDTSTGIGTLIIATKKQTFTYQTQVPRIQWQAGQFGTCLLFDAGISNQRAAVNVNSDLFFMGGDGQIRPLSMSRSEQGKWSKVPISREVQNWLKFTDKSLISYTAMGYFKNKIFSTCNPFRVTALDIEGNPITDVANGGFVILELDSISNMQNQSPPAWSGLWTGVHPMDIWVNNDRCFVMSKDSSSINRLYEITPNKNYDVIDGKIRYVRSRIYTRNFNFQSPYNNKEINSINFGLREIKGDFSLELEYKPVQASKYIPWRIFSHKAPWRACDLPVGCEYQGFAGQSFRDLNLGSPDLANQCEEVTKDNYSYFKELQLKITVKGIYWEIRNFIMDATVKPQNTTESICEEFPEVVVCKQCSDDWSVEGESLCQEQQT